MDLIFSRQVTFEFQFDEILQWTSKLLRHVASVGKARTVFNCWWVLIIQLKLRNGSIIRKICVSFNLSRINEYFYRRGFKDHCNYYVEQCRLWRTCRVIIVDRRTHSYVLTVTLSTVTIILKWCGYASKFSPNNVESWIINILMNWCSYECGMSSMCKYIMRVDTERRTRHRLDTNWWHDRKRICMWTRGKGGACRGSRRDVADKWAEVSRCYPETHPSRTDSVSTARPLRHRAAPARHDVVQARAHTKSRMYRLLSFYSLYLRWPSNTFN